MYIPPGFGTVTPYMFTAGAELLVDFLVNGLEGNEMVRTLRPDGKIANVQIRIGSTTVMISESTSNYPAMPSAYYLGSCVASLHRNK